MPTALRDPRWGPLWRFGLSFTSPYEREIEEFAENAYAHLKESFGPPIDPDWDMCIVYGPTTACGRDRFGRCYVIYLRRNLFRPLDWPTLYCAIAHEVYHRLTWKTDGLVQTGWIAEMMADRAALNVLDMMGIQGYRAALEHGARAESQTCNAACLVRVPTKHYPFSRRRPQGYRSATLCVGAALEGLVGWDSLCKLPSARTWEDWLDMLPDRVRAATFCFLQKRQLLESSGQSNTVRFDDDPWYLLHLAKAFGEVGDYDGGLRYCSQASMLDTDCTTHRSLRASLLLAASRYAEAADVWHDLQASGSIDDRQYFDLGLSLRGAGRPSEVITAFGAVSSASNWYPYAQFYLGLTLADMGQKSRAEEHLQFAVENGSLFVSSCATAALRGLD